MLTFEMAAGEAGCGARVVWAKGEELVWPAWADAADGVRVGAWWSGWEAGRKPGWAGWAPAPLDMATLVVQGEGLDSQGRFRAWASAGMALRKAGVACAAVAAEGAERGPEAMLFGAYAWRHAGKESAKGKELRVRWVAGEGKKPGKALARVLEESAERGEIQCPFRDLANVPANELGPGELAAFAKSMAKREGLTCKVWGAKELASAGCGGILGVGAGSAREPKLIRLEWPGTGTGLKPVALVGKGVMFDSGGICLKPAKGMEWMQYDKCGAMAVLAAVALCARRRVARPVVAWVPAADNMPGGRATKPGDIVTTASGLSVQVINTDAEGRMLLADALSMAGRESPAAMVDVATLTGAVVIALGHECTGGMGRGGVVAELAACGEKAGERIWELPMWREFGEPFESPFADLKNMGDGTAGTIEAAKFLERFVPEGMPWGHLDIAGTAWWEAEKAWSAPGATLAMARTLAEWAETTKAG